MDEEITIINTQTRNEKIKNFFIQNKKKLISLFFIFLIIFLSFYSFQIYNDYKREKISNRYNSTVISFKGGDKAQAVFEMKEIVNQNDRTYSPLALYFLIDNELIQNKDEINSLFDTLINDTAVKKEIKNLIIYKKALYNADTSNENELLNILQPIINSKSVWKSHSLYLLAEFFYSKNEKQKAKEFFNKILTLENSNQDLVKEAKKRLNRDLSD